MFPKHHLQREQKGDTWDIKNIGRRRLNKIEWEKRNETSSQMCQTLRDNPNN